MSSRRRQGRAHYAASGRKPRMRWYDTEEPLLHYFPTPQHYIAVVVYHSSTHVLFPFISTSRPTHTAKLHGWFKPWQARV